MKTVILWLLCAHALAQWVVASETRPYLIPAVAHPEIASI